MEMPKLPSARLDGRRALVTGAGRGLGVAMAAGLAQCGAAVTLVARSGDEVGAAAAAVVTPVWCPEARQQTRAMIPWRPQLRRQGASGAGSG